MTARNGAVPDLAAYSLVPLEKWQRRAVFCAALVGVSALIVLIEWLAGVKWFTILLQGSHPPNPVGTLALFFAAVAIWLLQFNSRRSSTVQLALGLIVAMIGGVRLLDLFAAGPSIDLWLSISQEAMQRTSRMVPRSALTVFLLGITLVLLHSRERVPALIAHGVLVLLLTLTTLTALEYLYGVRVVGYTNELMPWPAARGAMILALAAFGMTADRGFAPIVTNTTSAATLARRLLLAVVLGTAILGYMHVLAERHGMVRTSEQGVAAMVTIALIIGVGLLLWNASVQAKAEMFSAHLATIVRHSAAGIASATVEGKILTWNDAAQRIYGHPADEVIGKSISVLAPPEEQAQMMTMMKRIENGEGSVKLEGTRLTRDGRRIILSIRLSPIRTADGRIAATASVFEDITAERQRRAELEQTRKLVSVGQLAGGVAHHLNNSLTVVVGHADLARELLSDNHEAVIEVDAIRAGARDAARIVQMLMSAAGVRVLASTRLILSELVRSNEQRLAELLQDPARLLILTEPSPLVLGDAAAIVQAVSALLKNAAEASPHGKEIIIRTRPTSNDRSIIEVIDFGGGMDVETRRKSFEPFFTTKGLAVSSGMGLAMVHGTMRQLGGSVEIESAPGRGTTVRLVFPRAETA